MMRASSEMELVFYFHELSLSFTLAAIHRARQRGWQLNDSGLFNRGTTERILEATEERQVFDMLGLVYKHPHERDSFDALKPKTGEAVDYEPTKGEFREFQESAWIE